MMFDITECEVIQGTVVPLRLKQTLDLCAVIRCVQDITYRGER